MSELITSAAAFAAMAHTGQVRKDLNQPYINHPLRVGKMAAQLGMSAEYIAACYLHDVVEDTAVPLRTMEAMFPRETVVLVASVTKWWKGTNDMAKRQYYGGVLETPGAPLLKLLDRTDNLNDFALVAQLSPSGHAWAEKYLQKTHDEFPRILASVKEDCERSLDRRAISWFGSAVSRLELALGVQAQPWRIADGC